MEDEYVIINKTSILEELEELAEQYILLSNKSDRTLFDIEKQREIIGKQMGLAKALSQSTPLIPEIENAFDGGEQAVRNLISFSNFTVKGEKKEYISNLKLNV